MYREREPGDAPQPFNAARCRARAGDRSTAPCPAAFVSRFAAELVNRSWPRTGAREAPRMPASNCAPAAPRPSSSARRALKARFSRFGLELHPEKTRLIEFGRFAEKDRRARGERRPETFDFLGFTHYCRRTRKGRFGLGRKPERKRMSRTLKRIGMVLRKRMHDEVIPTGRWLGKVLRGWLHYYAVPTSFESLSSFVKRLQRIWYRILRERSQKDRFSWERLRSICAAYWPKLRIVHPWPQQRFAVNHRR